ncbi:MAG: ankyrin repeat domain-containing protein [Nitrospiria bacterium]
MLPVLIISTSFSDLVSDRDSVEAILAKGANVNEQDKMGRTTLMLAAHIGRTGIVQMLRKARAQR